MFDGLQFCRADFDEKRTYAYQYFQFNCKLSGDGDTYNYDCFLLLKSINFIETKGSNQILVSVVNIIAVRPHSRATGANKEFSFTTLLKVTRSWDAF